MHRLPRTAVHPPSVFPLPDSRMIQLNADGKTDVNPQGFSRRPRAAGSSEFALDKTTGTLLVGHEHAHGLAHAQTPEKIRRRAPPRTQWHGVRGDTMRFLNSVHRAPNTKLRTPNTEYRIQGGEEAAATAAATGDQGRSTEYRVPGKPSTATGGRGLGTGGARMDGRTDGS